MKTVLVIYTSEKVTDDRTLERTPKYAFNVDENTVQVGDMIASPSYDTPMQVVAVLEHQYNYYNKATGDLAMSHSSSKQWYIKSLVIREKEDKETVIGYKM